MVRDVDKGYKALVDRVFAIRKPKISVGITESTGAAYDGNLSVLDIAIINEFGLGNVPERSFLRAWFDENEGRCRQMVVAMMQSVIAGKRTKEQAIQLLALKFVSEIQARISAGIAPANAPSTIAAKGSSTPLIDKGILRSSISFRIEEGA